MFFRNPIIGSTLEEKTLCLSFDDGPGLTSSAAGPGPRTDDLSFYLFQLGIPATFFVIGNRADQYAELLLQLTRWGHLIANHTQTHTHGLGEAVASTVVGEVLACDFSLGTSKNFDSQLMRPPWGSWSTAAADCLNVNSNSRNLTGPVMWDIDGQDWQFWANLESPAACANHYFDVIQQAGKGIVLMHDNSFENPALNRTYEMLRLLVPRLLAECYRFVRLDAIPQVRSALMVSKTIALRASNKYISPQSGGGGEVLANGPAIGDWEELGFVPLAGNKLAIRTPSGHFLSAQPDGELLADAPEPLDWEIFELEPQFNNQVALRAFHTSRYLSVSGTTSQIAVVATSVSTAELLTLVQLS